MEQRANQDTETTEVLPYTPSFSAAVLAKHAEVLRHRTAFRETLVKRARVVERDIDQWAMQWVERLMQDPSLEIDLQPPRTLFDIEPPF